MSKKILIVDDDVEFCDEIAEVLKDEGYRVDNASDTDRGVALIKERLYDIYFLDYKMPGIGGPELLKAIKKAKPTAKVFMMTGRPYIDRIMKDEIASGCLAGVITKPFRVEVLLKKIL